MSFFSSSPRPDAPLACPRDKTLMTKVRKGKTVIDECATCGGSWYDPKELSAVVHDKDLERLAQRISLYKRASGFPCPRCAGECIHSYVQDVECDTCVSCHGIWLDAGELNEAKRELDVQRAVDLAPTGTVERLGRY